MSTHTNSLPAARANRSTAAMPTVFIGHGSPMNALGGNAYAAHLEHLVQELPQPKAILVVSAHWVTQGTEVLDTDRPKTIHDFYGFPPELYQMSYPAPGPRELVPQVIALLGAFNAKATSEWGLDHGAWTVLRHMYPKADIPVLQVSLGAGLTLAQHVEAGAALASLRQQGVLILGSGNITHNLRQTDRSANPKPIGWAVEFDQLIARALQDGDVAALTDPAKFGARAWQQAHPTLEHYIPLLYALGAGGGDPVVFPYQEMQAGSLSMRSVRFG